MEMQVLTSYAIFCSGVQYPGALRPNTLNVLDRKLRRISVTSLREAPLGERIMNRRLRPPRSAALFRHSLHCVQALTLCKASYGAHCLHRNDSLLWTPPRWTFDGLRPMPQLHLRSIPQRTSVKLAPRSMSLQVASNQHSPSAMIVADPSKGLEASGLDMEPPARAQCHICVWDE
jgi:hypothetical protein